MTHSPEPWKLETPPSDKWVQIVDANGKVVDDDLCRPAKPLLMEDFERIVACVNACAGIPTEDLDWVSVKDRLPTVADEYIVTTKAGETLKPDGTPYCQESITTAFYEPTNKTWYDGFVDSLPATTNMVSHWRSLPVVFPKVQ